MAIKMTVVKGPHKGRELTFEYHDNFIVGRAKFARFRLSMKDGYISRVHFLVEVNPPQCRLMDMGSTNGTLVNRKKVPAADLMDGDLIGVGKETVIRVSLRRAPRPSSKPPTTSPLRPRPGQRRSSSGSPRRPPSRFRGRPAATSRERARPSESTRTFHPGTCPCPSCGLPVARQRPLRSGVVPPRPLELCLACQAQAGTLAQPIAGFRLIRELGRGGMGVVNLSRSED